MPEKLLQYRNIRIIRFIGIEVHKTFKIYIKKLKLNKRLSTILDKSLKNDSKQDFPSTNKQISMVGKKL